MTAGRRLAAVPARRPAHLVAFDLLALDDLDLRPQPLHERRALLEQLLSGLSAPIALCQQTVDPALAAEWLQTLHLAGIEGVVIKDAAGPYPTREGQRVWHKLKTRHTLDMLAIGVLGHPAAPTALALGVPSRDSELRTAGITTVLPRSAARRLALCTVTCCPGM